MATAEACASELHAALGRRDFQAASKLVHAAPHAGVFEMLNPQQQNAVHLAGEHVHDTCACAVCEVCAEHRFVRGVQFQYLRITHPPRSCDACVSDTLKRYA